MSECFALLAVDHLAGLLQLDLRAWDSRLLLSVSRNNNS